MIEVSNLVKSFGNQRVLCGLSLGVNQGEVAAIMGPSGGGKSTLLRCLNGLEDFQAGYVDVAGVRLTAGNQEKFSPTVGKLRRRVGMVFQQFHLFPHRTVLENVIEAPIVVLKQSRAEAIETAMSLLTRVGLRDKCHAMPATLSGGQQQRVAIVRALAMGPDVILFDEPTSALDPRSAGEVEAVVASLAESGQTMVIVAHATGFVRRTAHVLHIIAEGRIVESGPPAAVFAAPRETATRELLTGQTEA